MVWNGAPCNKELALWCNMFTKSYQIIVYGRVWSGMIWSGMVGYGAALDANLVNWNKELAAAGVVASIKLMHTPQPWLQSTHITDSAFLAFRSWMVLGGVKKMHVCLAGRGRGRESSSEKYARPRRSSGCQKRSQKSAKATTGLKGRPQLFRFGQLGGPGVRS